MAQARGVGIGAAALQRHVPGTPSRCFRLHLFPAAQVPLDTSPGLNCEQRPCGQHCMGLCELALVVMGGSALLETAAGILACWAGQLSSQKCTGSRCSLSPFNG